MKSYFKKYYKSEIQNAWMRILAGSIFGLGAVTLYLGFPLALTKGILWAIIPIACYQIGRGIKKLVRTNKRKQELLLAAELPSSFIQSELQYLAYMMPKYKVHRSFEILLLSLGILLVLLGGLGKYGLFMVGTGMGLSLQGAIALYLELIAEWYGGLFLNRLKKIKQ